MFIQLKLKGLKMDRKSPFKSGASSSGSLPMYDAISIHLLDRLAARLSHGAEKHGKYNYRKGLNDKEFILDRLNHAFRHLKLAIDSIENEEISEDDDLGAVLCGIQFAIEYQHRNKLI